MGLKATFLGFYFCSLLVLYSCEIASEEDYYQDESDSSEQRERELNSNPYRHREMLDPRGRYQLEWVVDWPRKRVIFNVTAATSGYVGFGISRRGKMSGSDIVIGGVDPNGKAYFSDRYAIGNQLPEIDESQDWTLHEALEEDGQTFLSFSRPFETCDEDHDLPITDDLRQIIWAYGEKDDDIEYHFHNRGAYPVYLLDPDLVPNSFRNLNLTRGRPTEIEIDVERLPSDVRVFRMDRNITLPAQDTLYWCSFHKAPTITKRHVIGFGTKFPSERDRPFVHHLGMYRCFAPPESNPDTFFQEALNSDGSECYLFTQPNPLPVNYCRELVQVWAIGSKPFFFPEHVGVPVSERGSEYFMLSIHYDNPEALPGRRVAVALEAYYTNNLRENDAGAMWIGSLSHASASLIIPPSSLGHVTIGHCAEGCTRKMFPLGGITVFGALLHTHRAGRGMRILHFRGKEEHPWISSDDNYSINFQQNRLLNDERRVIPGDTLMTRCVYETTNRNGSVVVAGYPTSSEMCMAAIYYYNRVPGYGDCRSEIRTEEYADLIGIENTTFVPARRETLITEPRLYAGMSVGTYANTVIDWDLATRDEIQKFHLYEPHTSTCANGIPRAMTQTSGVRTTSTSTTSRVTTSASIVTPRPFTTTTSKRPFTPTQRSIITPRPLTSRPRQLYGQTQKPLTNTILESINGLQGILHNFLGEGEVDNTNKHSSTSTSTSTTSSTTRTTATSPTPAPPPPQPQSVFDEENIYHESVLPRDIPRYRRPTDCKNRR